MSLPRNNDLVKHAEDLRKNLTYPERKLWYSFLCNYPIPFRYQKIIGSYIVDFFCKKVRISIELDGESHYEQKQRKYDQTRTTYLEMLEIKELRFTNYEIQHNFDGVCEVIHREVQRRRNDLVDLPLSSVSQKQ